MARNFTSVLEIQKLHGCSPNTISEANIAPAALRRRVDNADALPTIPAERTCTEARMIFHASIPADDPERVARVLGELLGGGCTAFHVGSSQLYGARRCG